MTKEDILKKFNNGLTIDNVMYLKSTNHKFDYMIGQSGTLRLKKNCSAEFNNLKVWLVTSDVQNIEFEDSSIIVKTLNSEYTFAYTPF